MRDFTRCTDAELVAACRDGREDAWNGLVSRYERLVYTIPLRYGLSASEADDVFQSTWLSLLKHLATLREPHHIAAWLTTTARRASWDRRRGAGFTNELSVGDDDVLEQWADERTPEEIVAGFDAFRLLEGALEKLGERCRRLLWLLFQAPEKPSYKQIATDLTMPVGAIGPNRARCLAQLRRLML